MRSLLLFLILLFASSNAAYSQNSGQTIETPIFKKYKSIDDIPEDKLQEYYNEVRQEKRMSNGILEMKRMQHLQDMSIEELEAYNNKIEELYKVVGERLRKLRKTSESSPRSAGPKVTQYPAKIRTGLVRMIISGKQVEDIRFDPPTSKEIEIAPEYQVFSHLGGGSPYAMPEKGINDGSAWKYSKGNSLENIGTDNADIIAFLENVDKNVCIVINKQLGIGTEAKPVPEYEATPDFSHSVEVAKEPVMLKVAGQPFGCFQDADGTLYYHHVLIER